jgi:hypothetical protein
MTVLQQSLEIRVKVTSTVITEEMKVLLLMSIAKHLAIKPQLKVEELVCLSK